ncbi:ATP-binding protein [Desulfonatronum parangueonense]
MFVNREREIMRLKQALGREKACLIVVYGRRRCGKTTLLRHVLPKNAIYFAADQRDQTLQIAALARQADKLVPGFGKPAYPDWESLFTSLNLALQERASLCIDEFPYLVKNCPELPSIIQRLVDAKTLRYHLILCGSSQQMMHGMVLDGVSPLYGRSDEVLRVKPMGISHLKAYLDVDAIDAVREFGVWGGVPRYWEIRKQVGGFADAVKNNILDQFGVLHEEPERLFYDEMRTSTQAYSVLCLIGAGCHRVSEIAGRLGKPATHLSRLLGVLIDLGYVRRELPFGESVRSTKKTLYKIDDPFLNFFFTFLVPNKSRLEFGLVDQVWGDIIRQYDQYLSGTWEHLCRSAVPFLEFDEKRFNPSTRWWGAGLDGKAMELDLVAESVDQSTLLIGEAKWSDMGNLDALCGELERKVGQVPFVKGRKVITALFVKKARKERFSDMGYRVLTPGMVIDCMG